jgi:hypothetical protein
MKASISSSKGSQKINAVSAGIYVLKGIVDGRKYYSMIPVE